MVGGFFDCLSQQTPPQVIKQARAIPPPPGALAPPHIAALSLTLDRAALRHEPLMRVLAERIPRQGAPRPPRWGLLPFLG